MMWGAAGQAVCYALISGLLSQANGTTTRGQSFGAGATTFFFVYYLFFGICWQVRQTLFVDLHYESNLFS